MPSTLPTNDSTWYLCPPCNYIYKPEEGDPEGGIAPGTRFSDIPDDWVCPICGISKKHFIPYQPEII